MIWFGWTLSIAGLAAGSFSNTLTGLIMTQGVMYGGMSTISIFEKQTLIPSSWLCGFLLPNHQHGKARLLTITSLLNLVQINEWWVVRRGFAWGIIASASGASGAVFPFVAEAMLKRWGHKTTLRAIAIAMVVLTGPLLPFLRPRIPPSQQTAVAKADWSFLKKPLFWVYTTSNIAQALGFYFPGLFLPSYASSIGLSSQIGALLLAVMSIAQVLGQFTFGWLSDGRLPLNLLVTSSTLVAAISSLALWGLARSLTALIAFALVYGFFGFGYVSMRVRMGTAVTTEPTAALATFSLFCFGQGVGNVLAGPISLGLISKNSGVDGYGAMKYGGVVVFTGLCMAVSTISVGSWYLRPSRLRMLLS